MPPPLLAAEFTSLFWVMVGSVNEMLNDETTEYSERFIRYMLLGEENGLKNRELHLNSMYCELKKVLKLAD